MTRKRRTEDEKAVIFTIGHSTRTVSEFIEILKAFEIRKVVDIRTIPRSGHNPQFNEDALKETLKEAKIGYVHMKGLGGLRHARKDSPNTAWRNASFRGFADYMETEEFEENLLKLIETAEKKVTVIMCAEAVPWRCHRSLIGDALFIHGIDVRHIIAAHSFRDHTLTPWAKVRANRITYPAEAATPGTKQ
jgi:uncharacterized protein (DUF488 family)